MKENLNSIIVKNINALTRASTRQRFRFRHFYNFSVR